MAFLKIDGITIPVEGDSMREEEITIGDIFGRSVAGKLSGSLSTTKRKWSFTTDILSNADAERLRLWMEGRRQVWNTGGKTYSGAGVGTSVAGTLGNASNTHLSNGTNVGSGSQFGVDASNKLYRPSGWLPTNGWTIGFWSYRTVANDGAPSDGFHHYVAAGAVSVTRGAAANPGGVTQWRNGVAGSWNMGRIINVLSTGNFCGWTGYNLGAGVVEAKDYEDCFLLPFELPSTVQPWSNETWLSQLYTFMQTNLLGKAPIVKASGDWFPDSSPVEVLCRVRTHQQLVATPRGTSTSANNNRRLDVEMEEV